MNIMCKIVEFLEILKKPTVNLSLLIYRFVTQVKRFDYSVELMCFCFVIGEKNEDDYKVYC